MKKVRSKTKRLCIYPDCGRMHNSNGYCSGHVLQVLHGQELHPIKIAGEKSLTRICTVADCGKKLKARGLCTTHYNNEFSHKWPSFKKKCYTKEKIKSTGTLFINKGKLCDANNCDLPAMCKGYCSKHYQRLKVHGDISVNYKRGLKRTKYGINKSEVIFTASYEESMIMNEYLDEMIGDAEIVRQRYE